ncbi:2'-5' RNA ligase family protein [Actinoalloteichus hymeniacidonis]|uniref:2'-5' RNA ligase n=1 Tax=Actinoalloteichus hymeniacidonis TaxID=340345 RepID=A0AAC9N1J1_9PSEU|nr:2'-5' RNA ligase family protein [Actinoalloteichus hymeniacidonis]AOS65926.1 2'-5' RNA ligase [Actinoalloteichus hymeniacidonis]MBB5905978.1 2'-5' RNA ligase [Actinoalloteichus hymeniacidonis]
MTEILSDPAPALTRSALIVPIPSAEPAVGRHRRTLDRSAVGGVPAHVTVLYPFLPPDEIDDAAVQAIGEVLAGFAAFDTVFTEVAWFGEHLVWLRPEPDSAFRALTSAVWERFPLQQPYAGVHEPVPHLTVGDAQLADLPTLVRVAEEIEGELPIAAHVDEVRLMAGAYEPDSWRSLATFPLVAG